MGKLVSSSPATPGEIVTVNNPNAAAVTYRAEFPGAGWVEFVVPPGGSFRHCVKAGSLNLNIQDVTRAGALKAVDTDGNPDRSEEFDGDDA